MKNRKQSLVVKIAQLIFVSLPLVGFAFPIQLSTAQTNQDCEETKKQIEALQDELAKLTSQVDRALETLDDIDRRISGFQQYLDSRGWNSKFWIDSEKLRGILLELRAQRLRVKRQIEQDKQTIQAMKDTISDLLNKLGNCGAKTTPSPTPSPTPKNTGNQVGYHVATQTADGLLVTTFDTPHGKIKVNLTDDVVAGDTITGTVETEPAGRNDTERVQNQAELNSYVAELEGQKTKVGDKKITCTIPTTLTAEAKTIMLQHNGQTVATAQIPIVSTPPPAPTQLILPTGGQQGRTIQIKGACNGVFSAQDVVKIGGTPAPPLAESPRSLVVQNTSEVVGPTTIDCNENGVATECPFRNIGIKLSAPKLSLQRGESTALHVMVVGLAGITHDVQFDLVVTTPNVITMSGGDEQHSTIPSTAVQPDGTFSKDLTLTANQAGGFGVTATIRWSDVCKHPATP